jgi:hypothetical protein
MRAKDTMTKGRVHFFTPLLALTGVLGPGTTALAVDPNSPGIVEPVLTAINAIERRIPHTDRTDDDTAIGVGIDGSGPLMNAEGTELHD